MCIIGPSGPTGIFDPTAAVHERNFIMKFFRVKNLLTTVPFRNAMTSGTPELAASGDMNCITESTNVTI